METPQKNFKNSLIKKLSIGDFGLCTLLCTLSIVGAALGMGTLTAVAVYTEKIALVVFIALAGFLGYRFIKKKAC